MVRGYGIVSYRLMTGRIASRGSSSDNSTERTTSHTGYAGHLSVLLFTYCSVSEHTNILNKRLLTDSPCYWGSARIERRGYHNQYFPNRSL